MLTDHNIMLAVQNGDLDKLGMLFERYHKQLYNFFLKQTGDIHASEDLVQDVFVRILNYRNTYRGDSGFVSWMFSIAHNSRCDFYRKQKHRGESLELVNDMPDAAFTPEDQAIRDNHNSLLQQALLRLTDEKRQALVLSRYHNMKYEEIAQITGCRVGTVKARVHRALLELTHIYKELTGESHA
ncbi:MAG TPA: RNA polymerase sigma factor [bacterium]|nr:RNA polymerase sigma factor [bacterium]HPN45432.1 RNA polymerase sigma factor [bacterium]